MRNYVCDITHGGGFGGGFGGTYTTKFEYQSSHRANSRANYEDAQMQWRRKKGHAGWAEVVEGSACLIKD